MSEVKRCKQCGILKEVDQFRKYTYSKQNDTGGRFSICKSCESINSKYKKLLMTAGSITDSELEKIQALYEVLESKGLSTPLSRTPQQPKNETDEAINKLMSFYVSPTKADAKAVPTSIAPEIPSELSKWLDTPMDEWLAAGISPEFLQETIYISLKAKYRPQIDVDKELFIPIYDDTYKDVLNEILRKFDDYEEIVANATEEAE